MWANVSELMCLFVISELETLHCGAYTYMYIYITKRAWQRFLSTGWVKRTARILPLFLLQIEKVKLITADVQTDVTLMTAY